MPETPTSFRKRSELSLTSRLVLRSKRPRRALGDASSFCPHEPRPLQDDESEILKHCAGPATRCRNAEIPCADAPKAGGVC